MATYRISAIAQTENFMNGKRMFVQLENINTKEEKSFQINENLNLNLFLNKQFELEEFLTEFIKTNGK